MICDGMTQKTTALPHFKTKPTWKGKDELGVHVEGVMVQNRAPHLEFSLQNVRGDGNVLIDTVHRAVLREQSARQSEQKCMPEVFYLQLDNVNTNKSKDLLAYLSLLVKRGVFKKVKINFLLVGHTHENIDQLFSRFSVRLRKEDALTVKVLMKIAKECFSPAPTCEEIFGQRDWKKYIKPFRGTINDISYNHAFRIKEVDSKVVMHNKQYAAAQNAGYKVWLSEPVDCLLPQVWPFIPGTPSTHALFPLQQKDYDSLCNLQSNLEQRLSMSYVGETKSFWDNQVKFQQNVMNGTETVHLTTEWPTACTYIQPPGKYGLNVCGFTIIFV